MVKCDKCGTEDISNVFYCGPDSTHCATCWLRIVSAVPSFNIEKMTEQIAESLTFSGPIATTPLKVEPLATKANAVINVIDDDTIAIARINDGANL
jgi:hypothetical protein